MTLNIAIQMDPLDSINPRTDSTLLLGLEAQARGHALWYYTPDKLSWREGSITAQAQRVTFYSDLTHYYDVGEASTLDLTTMDVVLLRQDPPFNMGYISTTYILERLLPKTLVVNHPTSVRDLPEKLFPALLPQFTPPTLITADIKEIESFRAEHKDIVIKPLYGHGGNGVARIQKHDENFHALVEMLVAGKEPIVVQPFLPEVKTGDRRIILVDGEFAGVIGRIPAEGEIRANFRLGGTAAKAEMTKRQKEICEALAPELKKRGLIFAGIDVIGDWLTEVNITSPTGLTAINTMYGVKLETRIWDAIEGKL